MGDNIPLNDLKRLHEPLQSRIENAILRVVKSGRFVGGEEVSEFEKELAIFLGVDPARVVSCSSGTDAILMSLMAMGVGVGDRIVVPTFTFGAPALAILRLGATPVFVDIDPKTYALDLTTLTSEKAIDGIIAVHLFGQMADMDTVNRVAEQHGAFVIEDVAQAIGATQTDRNAGTISDVGCFSFFPTKNLGALGDAGACVARDSETGNALRQIRHHGTTKKYRHDRVGGNFRMDALQAAVLREKLPHLNEWNRLRREIAGEFLGGGMAAGHTYHRFVQESSNRQNVMANMAEDGIDSTIYYPQTLHTMSAFHGCCEMTPTPVADRVVQEIFAVPLFPCMTQSEIERVKPWVETP